MIVGMIDDGQTAETGEKIGGSKMTEGEQLYVTAVGFRATANDLQKILNRPYVRHEYSLGNRSEGLRLLHVRCRPQSSGRGVYAQGNIVCAVW